MVCHWITDEAKLRKDFWDTINNHSKISVNLLKDRDVKTYTMDNGNIILAIYVPMAKREQKPIYINTDFYVGQGVVIKKNPNEIIMENPGYVRIGKQQMLKGGISDPRNKALMKLFNMIGIGERAGSGVPDIFAVWEEEGWIEPEVNEQYNPDRTILKLPLEKQAKKTSKKNKRKKQAEKAPELKQTHKTLKNKEKILNYLSQIDAAKTNEIADILELSEARTRALLKELADEGAIESRGKTKKKEYYFSHKDRDRKEIRGKKE